MLKCVEAIGLCSQELDRPLALGERTSLRLHLMMCTGCTNYRLQLGTLRQAMQAYAQGDAVPGDEGPAEPPRS